MKEARALTWLHADRAITGDGESVLAPVWLEIRGSLIGTMATTAPDIGGDAVIDLGAVTLAPGLLNLHDHISRKILNEPGPSRYSPGALSFSQRSILLMQEDPNYLILHSVRNADRALQAGTTYLVDYGLASYTSVHLRRGIAEGLIEGPEISACGRPIGVSGGHSWRNSHEADGADRVMRAVREEIKAGADVIKFMASGGLEHFPHEDPKHPHFTEDELRAGVTVAHDLGVRTAAHAYPTAAILRAIRAGVDSIEHGALLNEECVGLMAERGTALVPTLTGLRTDAWAPYRDELQERVWGPQEEGMRLAAAAGVPIGAGTDSQGRLDDEIRLIGSVLGESAVRALSHATGEAARIVRRLDIGLLQSGRRANIVAFRGDLTRSLGALDSVAAVWKDGLEMRPATAADVPGAQVS